MGESCRVVLGVPGQGASHVGHLHTDLVVPAGQEMDFQLCLPVLCVGEKGSFPGDSTVFQNRLFGARRVGGADP